MESLLFSMKQADHLQLTSVATKENKMLQMLKQYHLRTAAPRKVKGARIYCIMLTRATYFMVPHFAKQADNILFGSTLYNLTPRDNWHR